MDDGGSLAMQEDGRSPLSIWRLEGNIDVSNTGKMIGAAKNPVLVIGGGLYATYTAGNSVMSLQHGSALALLLGKIPSDGDVLRSGC